MLISSDSKDLEDYTFRKRTWNRIAIRDRFRKRGRTRHRFLSVPSGDRRNLSCGVARMRHKTWRSWTQRPVWRKRGLEQDGKRDGEEIEKSSKGDYTRDRQWRLYDNSSLICRFGRTCAVTYAGSVIQAERKRERGREKEKESSKTPVEWDSKIARQFYQLQHCLYAPKGLSRRDDLYFDTYTLLCSRRGIAIITNVTREQLFS